MGNNVNGEIENRPPEEWELSRVGLLEVPEKPKAKTPGEHAQAFFGPLVAPSLGRQLDAVLALRRLR